MADPGIKPFAGTVTRLTETPLIAANMFSPAQIAGLEPDALANINGPSILRMPDWATGRRGTFHRLWCSWTWACSSSAPASSSAVDAA